jgi:uncharacterized protein (TIGR00251 family)
VKDGKIVFRVQVVPRSSRSEVVGVHNGSLKVKVAAPPVNGSANDELIRVIAKTFKVSRSAVSIVSGQSSRLKHIRIDGPMADIITILATVD